MFTDKIETDNTNIYLGDDKTLSINGQDSDKIIDLMNSIVLHQKEVDRVKNIAKHEHNKIINRGYTKQKLADRLVYIYIGLLFPIAVVPTGYMSLVIALFYVIGFKCVLNIADKLDKSARDEYDNKVKEYNTIIRELKFNLFNLEDELIELKSKNEVKEVHIKKISDIEQLQKLKESLVDNKESKEKSYTKKIGD